MNGIYAWLIDLVNETSVGFPHPARKPSPVPWHRVYLHYTKIYITRMRFASHFWGIRQQQASQFYLSHNHRTGWDGLSFLTGADAERLNLGLLQPLPGCDWWRRIPPFFFSMRATVDARCPEGAMTNYYFASTMWGGRDNWGFPSFTVSTPELGTVCL